MGLKGIDNLDLSPEEEAQENAAQARSNAEMARVIAERSAAQEKAEKVKQGLGNSGKGLLSRIQDRKK
jgi:hypothetical protein